MIDYDYKIDKNMIEFFILLTIIEYILMHNKSSLLITK